MLYHIVIYIYIFLIDCGFVVFINLMNSTSVMAYSSMGVICCRIKEYFNANCGQFVE